MTSNTSSTTSDFATQVKPKRNGLIELYRFLFAMWVVYYHGFFFTKTNIFSHGYLAVEFFFILTGFYLLKSIDKCDKTPFSKNFFLFIWKRLKSLGVAFIIGFLFSTIYFAFNPSWYIFGIFGYLWYIPMMLAGIALIYILRKFIKSDTWFFAILIALTILSYTLIWTALEGWSIFRAIGGISLGVLISNIPKLRLKLKGLNFNLLISLAIFATTIYLAFLPKSNLNIDYIMTLLCFPSLLYFSSQTTELNNPIFNFLGSLSFGLYAYQCILRILEYFGWLTDQFWLCIILISIVLAESLIKYIICQIKNIKQSQTKEQGS